MQGFDFFLLGFKCIFEGLKASQGVGAEGASSWGRGRLIRLILGRMLIRMLRVTGWGRLITAVSSYLGRLLVRMLRSVRAGLRLACSVAMVLLCGSV